MVPRQEASSGEAVKRAIGRLRRNRTPPAAGSKQSVRRNIAAPIIDDPKGMTSSLPLPGISTQR